MSTDLSALSEENAQALAVQKAKRGKNITLVALDCNWGPPISGRWDSDYFKIWAVAAKADAGAKVFVQGAFRGAWNLDYEMEVAADLGNHVLYRLSSIAQFPDEFVLRLELDDGSEYYDNNDFKNYKIAAYIGHSVTCVSTGGVIFDFGGIVHAELFFGKLADVRG